MSSEHGEGRIKIRPVPISFVITCLQRRGILISRGRDIPRMGPLGPPRARLGGSPGKWRLREGCPELESAANAAILERMTSDGKSCNLLHICRLRACLGGTRPGGGLRPPPWEGQPLPWASCGAQGAQGAPRVSSLANYGKRGGPWGPCPQGLQKSARNSATIYEGRITGRVMARLWTGAPGASSFAIVGKGEAPGVPCASWGPGDPRGTGYPRGLHFPHYGTRGGPRGPLGGPQGSGDLVRCARGSKMQQTPRFLSGRRRMVKSPI